MQINAMRDNQAQVYSDCLIQYSVKGTVPDPALTDPLLQCLR